MRINKMRKYFHKFSQLTFKETYGDQSRELVQSNFHYQPPLHNCRCHYSTSPTAKITSWQWPVFFSDCMMMVMKFDRSEWRMDDCRNHFDCVPFNTAALSMKLSTILCWESSSFGHVSNLIQIIFVYFSSIYHFCAWITIMEHSRHKNWHNKHVGCTLLK